MELINFLKENEFTCCDNIFIYPRIPSKQLNNAIKAYNVSVDPKEVVVLIDDTAFGSGKDGALICRNKLVIREMFGSARVYEYDAIDSVSCNKRRLFINDREAYKFNIPDKDDLEVFFLLLNQWILTLDNAVKSSVPEKSLLESIEAGENFGQLIKNAGSKLVSNKVYLRPHIPEKKLQYALNSYGSGISQEDVIILVDDTLFGSGKDGILITDNSIYIKIFSESLRVYKWCEIESIRIEKRNIYINGLHSGALVQTSEKDLGNFFEIINDFLCSQSNSEESKLSGLKISQSSESSLDQKKDFYDSALKDTNCSHLREEEKALITAIETDELNSHLANGLGGAANSSEEDTNTKAKDKLLDYVANAIEQNKTKIIPLLKAKTGEASMSALRDDTNVEKLARFLYSFLPSIVRLALKEEVFIYFMLDNRNKLLDKLVDSDILPMSAVINSPKKFSSDESDKYENQSLDMSGHDKIDDNPVNSVVNILEFVVNSLKQEGVDDPEAKILFDLAANHLSNLTLKVRNIKSSSRKRVEEQIGFMLSFMYGFSYHKIPEPIRNQEDVLKTYMAMLFVTLEKYKEFGGADLNGKDSDSIAITAYAIAKVFDKEQLNKMVRKVIDEYENSATLGDFTLDDIMSLLRDANSVTERWGVELINEMLADEREIQRKWGDLLS